MSIYLFSVLRADYMSKTKLDFKSEPTIAAALTTAAETETASDRNRFAEQRRTQISDGRAAVRAIKKISDLHG